VVVYKIFYSPEIKETIIRNKNILIHDKNNFSQPPPPLVTKKKQPKKRSKTQFIVLIFLLFKFSAIKGITQKGKIIKNHKPAIEKRKRV
jgi:hypothetical protein